MDWQMVLEGLSIGLGVGAILFGIFAGGISGIALGIYVLTRVFAQLMREDRLIRGD